MGSFHFEGMEIQAEDGETVLSALLRSDVPVKSGCRAGACQACLLRSSDAVPSSAQSGLDEELIERGAFLSCQTKASAIGSAERLGSELLPAFEAILIEKRTLSSDVLSVAFRADGFQARPGRFIRLSRSGITRPYSLAAPAWEAANIIRLHVRIIAGGAMSGILGEAVLGDSFSVEGPFGKCAYRGEGFEPIVLIGSGTGLAPLYAIATDALKSGHTGSIRLYHGGASASRLYFRSELRDLENRHPNFRSIPCVDAAPDPGDRLGSPLAAALEDSPNLGGHKIYLCGHPDLVKSGKKKCFLAGANLRDIAADPFEAA